MPKDFTCDIIESFPFSASKVFDIVIDIERYPEFLPWCRSVTVISKTDKSIIADVVLQFGPLKVNYPSYILYDDKCDYIEVRSNGRMFNSLYTRWDFIVNGDNSVDVQFQNKFSLKSKILEKLISKLYLKAQEKTLHSFIKRAYELDKKK